MCCSLVVMQGRYAFERRLPFAHRESFPASDRVHVLAQPTALVAADLARTAGLAVGIVVAITIAIAIVVAIALGYC